VRFWQPKMHPDACHRRDVCVRNGAIDRRRAMLPLRRSLPRRYPTLPRSRASRRGDRRFAVSKRLLALPDRPRLASVAAEDPVRAGDGGKMEPGSRPLISSDRDERLWMRATERALRRRLRGFSPFARSGLLYVLQEPDAARCAAIGKLWNDRTTRPLAELLIDLEQDQIASTLALAILRDSAD
jgi:hypothetical protein